MLHISFSFALYFGSVSDHLLSFSAFAHDAMFTNFLTVVFFFFFQFFLAQTGWLNYSRGGKIYSVKYTQVKLQLLFKK